MVGASGRLRRRRAFMLMREYLRRVGRRAHPERWLVLVDMARRLRQDDVAATEAGDPEAFLLGACLEAFVGAERAASCLQTADATMYRTKVEAWFAAWVLTHGQHPGFPFGHHLPVRFTRREAENTFAAALREASDEALQMLPLEIFCNAGDVAASQGDSVRALYWYHNGALVMQASNGGHFYADLALRALGFPLIVPSCDRDVVSDLAWLRQTYEEKMRGHRQNRLASPLIRYSMFIIDRALGIREATEIVCPPIPDIWIPCLPGTPNPDRSSNQPIRVRLLERDELCFEDERVVRMKLPDGTWLDMADWRKTDSPSDKIETYSAIGSDGREYFFYRSIDDSAWGVRTGERRRHRRAG